MRHVLMFYTPVPRWQRWPMRIIGKETVMEPSEITHYKELATNAMAGHIPDTPDMLYDLGKALEAVCEEVERLEVLANGY